MVGSEETEEKANRTTGDFILQQNNELRNNRKNPKSPIVPEKQDHGRYWCKTLIPFLVTMPIMWY